MAHASPYHLDPIWKGMRNNWKLGTTATLQLVGLSGGLPTDYESSMATKVGFEWSNIYNDNVSAWHSSYTTLQSLTSEKWRCRIPFDNQWCHSTILATLQKKGAGPKSNCQHWEIKNNLNRCPRIFVLRKRYTFFAHRFHDWTGFWS